MKFKLFSTFILFSISAAQSQDVNGYWDNQRITNKEIKLSAGDKIVIKSEDFPVGTTEFVYRITLLDENQKMVSDLASVLKAIPDPYFIGKGTGGALSLASSISGSDKCTYAVFTDEFKANEFSKNADFKTACLYQPNPVSKDAKVVSAKSTCIKEETKNVWFAFENQNWLMNEKIVLEIVPWVDNVASRGWSQKNKQVVVDKIASFNVFANVRKDIANAVIYRSLDRVMEKYRFQDFNRLNTTEQNVFLEKSIEDTFTSEGYKGLYSEFMRFKAYQIAFKDNKIDDAIVFLNNRITKTQSTDVKDFNLLGELYIQSNQFDKALKTLKTAENSDSSELKVQMNLAHVYMFMDEVSKAKEIHKKYMNQNVSAKQTWKNKAINDLDRFKKMNLPQDNIQKIWRLYN